MGYLDTYVKAVKRRAKARRRPRLDDLEVVKPQVLPEEETVNESPVRSLLILESSEVQDIEEEVSRIEKEESLSKHEAWSKAFKKLLQRKQVKHLVLRLHK